MLLDTSGLLSVLDDKDAFHELSARLFRSSRPMVTHDYVLAELVPLAQTRGVPRALVVEFIRDILDAPSVRICWTDEAAYRAALVFLEQRSDKTYSLCDAASFVLMRRLEIGEALTTDRHFEQEGFVRLLKR